MSNLTDWCAECEKCLASEITLTYPAGEMMIDFRTYLMCHRYGKIYVKKLLPLSNSETRAVMLNTVDVLMKETRAEFRKIMGDYQAEIDRIDNIYLFESERKAAKKPVKKKCEARRNALNTQYEKLMKIKELIENE